MSVGKWTYAYVCIECLEKVWEYAVHHNGGICPHCGHNSGTSKIEVHKVRAKFEYEYKSWFMRLITLFETCAVIPEEEMEKARVATETATRN